MYYTYIIFSESLQQYYRGSTQNIANRLAEHNAGETQSIKHGCPWKLVGYLTYSTRAEAMQKEKQIKGRGIKRWLEYRISYLELCN